MLSRFFLDRPVFAWVIAIIIMAAGGLAIYNLPISQYPPIAPPSIAITAFYPGASAETVENSVTQIIEQKMTGFDRMLYLSATSDSSGIIPHRADLRPGHRSGSGLGAGAEQAPARHGEPAGSCRQPGRQGQQIHPQLADDRGPDLRRREHGRQRPARLCPIEFGKSALAGARRGRGGDLRQPVRHARLAQPRQADQLRDDGPGRRSRRFGPTTWKCPPGSSAGRRR